MAWIWVVTIAGLVLALLSRSWPLKNHRKGKKLPPGPKGFPIVGSLHLLGKLPHRNLHQLSQKYGPIMCMKLGLIPTIIVSSTHAAELFLKTHDLVFASRPSSEASKHILYNQKSLSFSPYSPYWRNMRKMCTLELLNSLKINSFKPMRKQELGLLIESLREAAHNRAAVNLSSKVTSFTTDNVCLMAFGKKYEDKEFDKRGFKSVIQQGLQLIINEHLEATDGKRTKDFVDVMLDLIHSQQSGYQIDRSSIKAIMLDILAAAMDTSATTVGWAMSELIRHPHIMRKMQDELEKVVGLNRLVEESDLKNLEYSEMVVKEILRLHPPAPLLVPHESVEDCTVDDFHIPKKSRIIVNAWAIGRDPSAWIDPEKFIPDRFIGSQVDVKGKNFQLIPFGAGRRSCPGMQLGLIMVNLLLAQLVHCFDWELPNGMTPSELDMTEKFGLTCPRARDLMIVPSYRLNY
ncbi:cytochrome P450 CYP736A12-like isoform X2 [Cucurbita pepo subsp. pepo]|uniref:cytochrome P450 CYP736A12-like isoform X2 n=1 Tax=Cucurbita pepo subsp. pepo TaxID=3664 RepID=UPI000C9D97D9|nr:cytochrome P450 CYP736A12-like isoform X2 [Cucurbita pepo subsp. pepo]